MNRSYCSHCGKARYISVKCRHKIRSPRSNGKEPRTIWISKIS